VNVCDVRIGWALKGCRARWAADPKDVATTLPASVVAVQAGRMARALAFENAAAEHHRAVAEFKKSAVR
jgi:hypothetical protein